MNNSFKHKAGALFSLFIIGIFYQNFNFYSRTPGVVFVGSVDQKARVHHAKELLGNMYAGSLAQQAEQISDLHVTIYEDVEKNLPAAYQAISMTLTKAIITEAQAKDLDPVFVMAVIKTESSFNPKARGSHGEIGLMQIKPDTAKWIAEQEGILWHGPKTLENPVENVKIGVAYMSLLRTQSSGFANKYVAAYNMGLTKVRRLYKISKTPREYSVRVMKNYREIYKRMVASRVTSLADN